ncbi:hypothetical protein NL676_029556 [Syzygium grande]|nr:hypothetical protein NL676_029556 [Syzygium grande]
MPLRMLTSCVPSTCEEPVGDKKKKKKKGEVEQICEGGRRPNRGLARAVPCVPNQRRGTAEQHSTGSPEIRSRPRRREGRSRRRRAEEGGIAAEQQPRREGSEIQEPGKP